MNENISFYRKIAIYVAVGTLTIAAFAGILAILVPNSIGDTGLKTIGSTVVIGLFAIVELCYLIGKQTFNRYVRSFGTIFATATAGKGLFLIWVETNGNDDHSFKILATTLILSLVLAQNNLLYTAATTHKKKHTEYFLSLTIGISIILTFLSIGAIWELLPDTRAMEENSGKAIASLLILDVLGVLVILILGIFGARTDSPENDLEIKIFIPLEVKNKISLDNPETPVEDVIANLVKENYPINATTGAAEVGETTK